MGEIIRLRVGASTDDAHDAEALGVLPAYGLSPFLVSVAAVAFDFDLGRPDVPRFLLRASGTDGDGRDAARAALAGGWILGTCAPAWLRATGRESEAACLEDAAGELGAVTGGDLATAGRAAASVRAELRARVRAAAPGVGSLAVGAPAALWAGVADRYAGRPGPLWFEAVRHAWTASWMGERLLCADAPEAATALRNDVDAAAWNLLDSLVRPSGPLGA